jgi:hypothetical protein
LRLLRVRKLAPATAARSPANISHSTFAPVAASVGVVVAAGAAGAGAVITVSGSDDQSAAENIALNAAASPSLAPSLTVIELAFSKFKTTQ